MHALGFALATEHTARACGSWLLRRNVAYGNRMKRLLTSLAAVALFAAAAAPQASAGLITFTSPNCGGFENCSNAAFDAAIGAPDLFLSFSTDKNGNPVAGGTVEGNIFSDAVTFSTAPSSFNLAGSTQVEQGNGNSASSEIGPTPGFNGILNIVFNTPALAVGFGTVEFDEGDAIRILQHGRRAPGHLRRPIEQYFRLLRCHRHGRRSDRADRNGRQLLGDPGLESGPWHRERRARADVNGAARQRSRRGVSPPAS